MSSVLPTQHKSTSSRDNKNEAVRQSRKANLLLLAVKYSTENWFLTVVAFLNSITLPVNRHYMKHLPIDPELFVLNRKRFVEKMKPSSIAVFVSNDEVPSNGDALHPFRQNSDLYWLSGIMQEDSMVILYPDNPDPKFREVLVLVRPNELKEKWDGKRLRKEEAIAMSGYGGRLHLFHESLPV